MSEYTPSCTVSGKGDSTLKQLMRYAFAEHELALFLDTHPTDLKALEMHRSVAEKLKRMTDEYVRNYGPLTTPDATSGESWQWLEGKWPWEN